MHIIIVHSHLSRINHIGANKGFLSFKFVFALNPTGRRLIRFAQLSLWSQQSTVQTMRIR